MERELSSCGGENIEVKKEVNIRVKRKVEQKRCKATGLDRISEELLNAGVKLCSKG